VRQQTRWQRSAYREWRWTLAALRGRSRYLHLDTTARLLAPLLLAPLLMLAGADAVVGRGDPGRGTAAVAAALTSGALTTVGCRPRSARFTLLYGALFIGLLPVRLWSLRTRAREHWGTRGPQPHSAS
jgi:hypothetical protein